MLNIEIEENPNEENEGTEVDVDNLENNTSMYTKKYRVVKTLLLLFAFIVYGLNFEMVGPTLEDLRIQMNVNYTEISFGLVLRNLSFLIFSLMFGIVILNRITQYSDMFMALASFIIMLSNTFIPLTSDYVISMFYYVVQGLAQSIFEVCGNYLTLNIWKQISESPINAVHAGYGIGALISTQLSKPFIKFNSINERKDLMHTDMSNFDLIDLRTPYWLAASLAGLVGILFILAQFIESDKFKIKRSYKALHSRLEDNVNEDKRHMEDKKIYFNSSRTQLFNILLFLLLCLFVSGYMTVTSRFMLTYLTLGPAKFSLEQFARLQTLFWLLFIFSRFLITFLTFKLSSQANFSLYLFLLGSTFIINLLFLIPVFQFTLFFWSSISLLGLVTGPLLPTIFLLARQQINPFKPYMLALFVASFAFGGIVFQQITGNLLDILQSSSEGNSSYILPYLTSIASLFSLLTFLTIYMFNKKIKS